MSFWLRADVDFDAFRDSYENLEDKSDCLTYESYMQLFPKRFAEDGSLYPDVHLTVVQTTP